MEEGGAGANQGPPATGGPGGAGPEAGPDWAGLPEHVLMKVAEAHVAQTEAGWAAHLKGKGKSERLIQIDMAWRKRGGNCLFVFALVCKGWRKAQLKVGGPLRTRVSSDVIMPGSKALVKWALAEGCPIEDESGYTMAISAAAHGHRRQLVLWLMMKGTRGYSGAVVDAAAGGGHLKLVKFLHGTLPVSTRTCALAAQGGHLEVLQYLRDTGCPWDYKTCRNALTFCLMSGKLEVLRWARANGCEWERWVRDTAARCGYTDGFGNLYS